MEYACYNSNSEKYLTAPYAVKAHSFWSPKLVCSGAPTNYKDSEGSLVKFCKDSLFCIGETGNLEIEGQDVPLPPFPSPPCSFFFCVLNLTGHNEFMGTGCFCLSSSLNSQSTPVGSRNFRFRFFLWELLVLPYLICKSILWERPLCWILTLKGRI